MNDKQKNIVIEMRKEGLTYACIATKVNVSRDTVKSYCRRQGLVGFEKTKSNTTYVKCRNCNSEITQLPNRKRKIFCCDECRVRWWSTHQYMVKGKAYYNFICLHCGKQFTAYGNSHRKYCCHKCYIEHRFPNSNITL